MLEEATNLIGLEVYTDKGIRLGTVDNIRIDITDHVIDGLFINETNPLLVEEGVAINVPFRWVMAIGEIIILRYFPERITLPEARRTMDSGYPSAEPEFS